MRLQATLLWLASCVPSAVAIYPDEVNHVDFHHALLGVPTPESTFFLRPPSSSNASLLYTLSEDSLVGAINPRDGSPLWRQNVSRSSQPDHGAGLLRAADGVSSIVSAVGDYVSSWSALDGKLVWENWFVDESLVDLELLHLADPHAVPSSKDTVALFGGKTGVVRRLDGESGDVKWEYKDERLVSGSFV